MVGQDEWQGRRQKFAVGSLWWPMGLNVIEGNERGLDEQTRRTRSRLDEKKAKSMSVIGIISLQPSMSGA